MPIADAVASGGVTNPAGSNTQIQYNNNGSFGANSNLTYNGTTFGLTGFFTTTECAVFEKSIVTKGVLCCNGLSKHWWSDNFTWH